MGVAEAVNDLAKTIADLYKEVVTTSVRFEELQRSTDKTLTRYEDALTHLTAKLAGIHDDHVRENAVMLAEVSKLESRLDALSEQALHSVARDVARELLLENTQRPSTRPSISLADDSKVASLPLQSPGA
jgi:uncharacterized protein Yka (UPF0111/DUF47 family)